MRLVRFKLQGQKEIRAGIVRDGMVHELGADIFGPYDETGLTRPEAEVVLQAPCRPGKVVAVGLNYRDHAEEFNFEIPKEPMIFLKPASAVIGPGAPIILPPLSRRVDFEAELAVVIGRRTKNVSRAQAPEHVLGYTCLNDVTARDLQKTDGQWTRAKSFDTFCPIGPAIETELDPSDLAVETWLGGERRQASRTSNLVFDVPTLVEFISAVMTLEPGDVIAAGTPSGVGPLAPGDEVEIRVEGVGSLINPVLAP